MNKLKITVSPEAVIRRVYAMAALRSITEDPEARLQPLLTEAEKPALTLLVNDAYSWLLLRMLPSVGGADAPTDADDGLPMTLDLLIAGEADGGLAINVSRRVEHILSLMTYGLVMAVRHGSVPHSIEDEAGRLADTLKTDLARTGCGAGRIIPRWL